MSSYFYQKKNLVPKVFPVQGMRRVSGVEVYFHVFLTSAVDEGEWSGSGSGRFTPVERTPIPIVLQVGWTSELLWAFQGREKSRSPNVIRTLNRPVRTLGSIQNTPLRLQFSRQK